MVKRYHKKGDIYKPIIYPFPMIFSVFGHRSEAVFSSPISPSREPTLGVKTGPKILLHLEPKIPEKSSERGMEKF